MARPLAVMGAAYFAAQLFAVLMGLNLAVTSGVLCFLAFLLCVLLRPLRRFKGAAAALFFAAAACTVYACVEGLYVRPLMAYDGTTQQLRLQVTGLAEDHGLIQIYPARVSAGPLPAGTRVELVLSDRSAPEPYDTVEADCALHMYDIYTDKERGFRAKGILFAAYAREDAVDGAAVIPAAGRPWYAFVLDLRRYALDTVGRYLSGDTAGLVKAVCFGEKMALTSGAKGDFRDAGVSHLLAVSGLHMSVLSMAIFSLLTRLRLSRRVAAGITAPVTLLFMAVLGFPPSAARAGVMTILLMLGLLIGREADSLNSLGLAVWLLLLPNPYAVLDVGLQLSFAATLGLLGLHPWLKEKAIGPLCERLCPPGGGRWRRTLLAAPVELLGVTVAATAPTLPIVAAQFGSISRIAPAANLLMVPAAPVVLLGGCMAVLLSPVPWLTFAVRLCFGAAGLTANYFLAISHTLASWPWATIHILEPYQLFWIPAAMGLLYLGWRLFRGHGLRMAAAVSVIALTSGMLFHGLFMRGVTVVTVQHTGGGSALLLQRDGLAGLILTDNDFVLGSQLLRERGIRRLDFLVTTELYPAELPNAGMLIQTARADCLVIAPEDGAGGDTEAVDAEMCGLLARRGYLLGNQPLRFWDDGMIEQQADGWLRMTVDKTRLLICPTQGDAAQLDEDWRRAHLVVYNKDIPVRAALLTAQGGIVSAREEELPAIYRAIPWGSYPIEIIDEETATAMTRGRGDLQISSKEGHSYAAGRDTAETAPEGGDPGSPVLPVRGGELSDRALCFPDRGKGGGRGRSARIQPTKV